MLNDLLNLSTMYIRKNNEMSKNKYGIQIPDSKDAYARLVPITDAAQSGELKPWSPAVVELLASYGIRVQRLKDDKAQATVSFPTSIKDHRSMAIGFRYVKSDSRFAEDLFVFVEDVGLTCYYRGAQEKALPEYAGSHHAKIELSEFLPDIQRDIADMRQQLSDIKATSGVELITDEMHRQAMQDVKDEFNDKVRSFSGIHGSSASAVRQYSIAVQKEATKKRRALMAKKALSDRVYQSPPPPEIGLIINARASDSRFDVQLVNNSNQALVAESIWINDTGTQLNQQFTKLFPIEHVNSPEGIFDHELDNIIVVVRYRTLDGRHFELEQQGTQEHRVGDGRYNVIFPSPVTIRTLG